MSRKVALEQQIDALQEQVSKEAGPPAGVPGAANLEQALRSNKESLELAQQAQAAVQTNTPIDPQIISVLLGQLLSTQKGLDPFGLYGAASSSAAGAGGATASITPFAQQGEARAAAVETVLARMEGTGDP